MDLKQYNLALFYDSIDKLDLKIDDNQISQFMDYYELLIEWNSFMNLTAITEFEEVCMKHFIDSISLCKAVDCAKNLSVIDVGTGAGFPGIPLKIAFPELKITLLDSLGKRVRFLNEVIGRLGLENIEAIHGRAEDFAKPDLLREKFDLCVSRAVANLSTLSEYCLPYVKVDGFFISYKSGKISDEMQAAQRAIELLGGAIDSQKEFILPGSDICRILMKIKKIKETPKKYPRKAGLPSKEPLSL
ncbi:MAG: 16S rRNA (guanine(527)-N(7))-methyltransferase RsmG [Lachnospiraceae bacterium]|nr:16S rRNA (guanine(527)-N(7))-methyltransferase RsmG [Lachnospiraceae bacterium]MDE7271958.1 16S rRNA (guanine(527)-N(7))-methyltransferase RsmG [Lachnospiraceae bacterium]